VTYGGNTYISLLPHASTTFATDLTANKWQKFNSGIRFLGVWSASTVYYKDDVVQSGSSTYICTVDTTSGGDAPSIGNTNFLMLAAGAEGFLALAGGAMTGDLTLSGDPVNNLHAAPKQYVDNVANTKVALTGGTLTGALTLSSDPTSNLHAASKQYVDNQMSAVAVDQIPFVTTISTNKTLPAGNLSFGMGTLTISGSAVYTIASGAYHFVLNPDGFALFN